MRPIQLVAGSRLVHALRDAGSPSRWKAQELHGAPEPTSRALNTSVVDPSADDERLPQLFARAELVVSGEPVSAVEPRIATRPPEAP